MEQQNLEQLAESLGITTRAGVEALNVALENIKLLDRKQRDYGPHNISAFGLFGCVVRLNDKVERFKHLSSYSTEQKKAMRKMIETMTLFDRDWHKLNMLQCLDHLDDAMTQFKVLFAKKRKPAINEKLRDTFRDISNYAVIALLLDTDRWPTKED